MDTSHVYKALKKSTSLEFLLENTYIFNWESDIFGVSKTGYINEIEVKSSRSDFLADFKKTQKHNILKLAHAKKTHATLRGNLYYSCEKNQTFRKFDRETQSMEVKQTDNWISRDVSTKEFEVRETDTVRNIKYKYSEVSFVKIFCPNRFYYACPKGLLQKSEIPQYAVLMYVDEDMNVKTVKQAPLLHKQCHDLTGVLLHKFYHKSIGLENDVSRLKSQINRMHDKVFEGDFIGDGMVLNLKKTLEFL